MVVTATHQLAPGVMTNQRFPEAQLGAAAWRRRDLLKWLKKFEDKIGLIEENQPRDAIIKLVEAYQMQGILPALPGQESEAEPRGKVADLERQVAELTEVVKTITSTSHSSPTSPVPQSAPEISLGPKRGRPRKTETKDESPRNEADGSAEVGGEGEG